MSEPQIAGTSTESTASTSASATDPSSSSSSSCVPPNGGEFLSTGRTGRRNALGDILDANTAFLSTADLPDQLSALSFGSDQCGPSTSTGAGGGLYSAGPSTSSSPPQ